MLLYMKLLALSVLPGSLGQIKEDFESGWDQGKWPTYTGGCSQGGKFSPSRGNELSNVSMYRKGQP
jgi:hypothetical protein